MQKVIPAILEQDPKETEAKLTKLQGVTEWVHMDIMDGKFVQNASHGISEMPEIAKQFNLEFHLMVKDPIPYLALCDEMGANRVVFHFSATDQPAEVLAAMNEHSFLKAIALNPDIEAENMVSLIDKVDSVMLMSVHPGFQGSEFQHDVLNKVLDIQALNPLALIGMDGGIKDDNIQEAFSAGTDYVVVGSGVWKTDDPIATLRSLQSKAS